MALPIALLTLLALNQQPTRTNQPKRVTGTIPAPTALSLENLNQPIPPTGNQPVCLPPDIDLRLVELQALVGHYQRLCDMLLELEFEYEMNILDTGADHPEKNRGIKRLEVMTRRKKEIGLKIEAIRAELKDAESKKRPAGRPGQ